ncbi:short-chain dehydrogenase TIC 32, chloroplastic-like [Iris pallida]|uniref:Short-chain dehydrogenase TIC 32, chloroplastic-like n=1 Tax=Iris pallida TaxID=29817 RepID=A0AAX6IAX5_IRIPA|nr:short-chain dehydrogenase TIC 32, chloroplastic-like [Iris pallida]
MRGVHVVMGVRNLSAGNDVKEAISKEVPTAKVDVLSLDLSSMASVRRFASDFDSLELPLNILVNNAGIMGVPFSLSHDGMELHFATNHEGHFLLTHLLLKNMKDTSCRSNFEGRIVNVTSEGHKLVHREGIRFNRINDESGYFSYFAYGQSKLANILHANELSRRLEEEEVKITANSVHPGVIFTNLYRYHSIMNAFTNTLGKMVMKNVQQGAATTCYVALHPQVEGVTGKYFSNSNLSTPSKKASDADLAKKLWDFSLNVISAQHQAPINT